MHGVRSDVVSPLKELQIGNLKPIDFLAECQTASLKISLCKVERERDSERLLSK